MPKEANKKQSKDKKHFMKDFKAELKRVIWPTPKQLLNNTVAVITIVLITAVIVFALDVVFESMDAEEQRLIEEYYGKGKSIDTLLEMQREKGQFVSKSTMRRRKLRVVEKARKVIFMVTSLDRGCLEP